MTPLDRFESWKTFFTAALTGLAAGARSQQVMIDGDDLAADAKHIADASMKILEEKDPDKPR